MISKTEEVISVRDFSDDELTLKNDILDAMGTTYNDSIKTLEGHSIQTASDVLLGVMIEMTTGIFMHIFNNFPSLRENIGKKAMIDASIEHIKARIMKELESELH